MPEVLQFVPRGELPDDSIYWQDNKHPAGLLLSYNSSTTQYSRIGIFTFDPTHGERADKQHDDPNYESPFVVEEGSEFSYGTGFAYGRPQLHRRDHFGLRIQWSRCCFQCRHRRCQNIRKGGRGPREEPWYSTISSDFDWDGPVVLQVRLFPVRILTSNSNQRSKEEDDEGAPSEEYLMKDLESVSISEDLLR